jgi:hypothetical protein
VLAGDSRAVSLVGRHLVIAAVAVLLAVELVATNHHRPKVPRPTVQSEILLGKKFCPIVNAARAAGMTDDQIIAMAVIRGVPPHMILWAKKNCIVANGPRSSLQGAQT